MLGSEDMGRGEFSLTVGLQTDLAVLKTIVENLQEAKNKS